MRTSPPCGVSEDSTRVGDLFRIGTTLFQVTQPRIPCYKLAIRMAEEFDFPARFQASGRLGFYFRAREQGDVGAGDTIELVDRDEKSIMISEFIDTYLSYMHVAATTDQGRVGLFLKAHA